MVFPLSLRLQHPKATPLAAMSRATFPQPHRPRTITRVLPPLAAVLLPPTSCSLWFLVSLRMAPARESRRRSRLLLLCSSLSHETWTSYFPKIFLMPKGSCRALHSSAVILSLDSLTSSCQLLRLSSGSTRNIREQVCGDCVQPTWAMTDPRPKHTDIPSDQCLLMDTRVIKSDSDEQVFICTNCQERERKRAQRKKNPKVKPEPEIEEDSEVSPDDPRRIILFNSGQHLEFGSGQATIPARIACYCRHHKEKTGFR